MIRLLALVLVALYAHAQDAQKATVCEIKQNPAAYNRKLVEITGSLSQGFENFTLSDPKCDEWPGLWVEYGGSTSTGVVYCCGRHDGVSSVDGIATPLVRDDRFRQLDGILKRSKQGRATIVGRFFAKPSRDEGYGHFGCCHLFVLQQVLAVNPR